jgi:hypothetical protein
MSYLNLADDCELMVRVLEDAPPQGLSFDEILPKTPSWTFHKINAVLCALGSKVTHEKQRDRNRKVTRYRLKLK